MTRLFYLRTHTNTTSSRIPVASEERINKGIEKMKVNACVLYVSQALQETNSVRY